MAADHRLKLGDTVVVRTGRYAGQQGYIVGITSESKHGGSNIVKVRFQPGKLEATFSPSELRSA